MRRPENRECTVWITRGGILIELGLHCVEFWRSLRLILSRGLQSVIHALFCFIYLVVFAAIHIFHINFGW